MATSLWQLLKDHKVIIPLLQRDYAQGRNTGKVPQIRKRFLKELCDTLSGNTPPLELDFIYGYNRNEEIFTQQRNQYFIPLDGQQRLTTLFLLHWYVACNEGWLDNATETLKNFTYETRHSSRGFCNELAQFQPNDLGISIKTTIKDQPWFFTAWKNDPTINAMLTMLDDIQHMIRENSLNNLWQSLISESPLISFHLLPMDQLGLPDDLYIKMNSRGKELTNFEHFKSKFAEILTSSDASIFNRKIDQQWSDLFFDLHKSGSNIDIAKQVDDSFLRFFNYISNILSFINEIDINHEEDDLEVYEQVYSHPQNVIFLFRTLDIFYSQRKDRSDFFSSYFYVDPADQQLEKTRFFFQNPSPDLFKKCASQFDTSQRNNPFSFGEQITLYAAIINLLENTNHFDTRIRIVRNLISNSGDELRGENMPSLLLTVSDIIKNGNIAQDSKFNKLQVQEERKKQELIQMRPELKDSMRKLEDHRLLQGCLAIFDFDNTLATYTEIFETTFNVHCDHKKISKAMLCFGDYSQDRKYNLTQFGVNDKTWRELFTPSRDKTGFEKTKKTLSLFLENRTRESDTTLDQLYSDYLSDSRQRNCFDWRYYFIQYPEFTSNNEDGCYIWRNGDYDFIKLRKTKTNGFHWSPFLLSLKQSHLDVLSLENYNEPLTLVGGNNIIDITHHNNGYKIESRSDESSSLLEALKSEGELTAEYVYLIEQNNEGHDTVDRIEKGITLLNKLVNLIIP